MPGSKISTQTIMMMKRILVLLLILNCSFAGKAKTQNAVTALELKVENPTLISLGFDWRIEGDENLNAMVAVFYRKNGEKQWREYLPLFRTGRGRMADYGFNDFPDPNFEAFYKIPEGFAGSIMDLEPDTEYEVKLEMTDSDGVNGKAVRQFNLKTRHEPMPFAGGEVRHVYPADYEGVKEQPVYRNLMHAVNGFQTWCDNYQTIHPNRARPGTVIKVHAGVYKTDYHDYRDPGGLWLHGMQTFTADGEPGKPIAIVAAGDGEVILDANGSDRYFNIATADYLYFEGLTIKNTRIAFYAGLQGLAGCKGLTVKNCRIENVQYGILAQDARSEDFYIADNVFIGKNPIDRFNPESSGAYGKTEAGYAVNLAGQGHVVCYNYVASFWDGINIFTNSLADPAMGQQSRSIDFYNNDIYNINDNFIEADGGYANIRILRNRCFNGMSQPLSTQPVYSGPVYWIRNIVFNASQGAQTFKMVNGDNVLYYHNTSTSHHSHYNLNSKFKYVDVRNNLFMGPVEFVTEGQKKRGLPIFLVMHDDDRSIVDYNAVRVGRQGEELFCEVTDGEKICTATMKEFSRETGLQEHGITIKGYDIFMNAKEPDHAPSNKGKLFDPAKIDLRPKSYAPVVDAGCVLPGINDDFSGKAPDIGAYESDQKMPHYGPRNR